MRFPWTRLKSCTKINNKHDIRPTCSEIKQGVNQTPVFSLIHYCSNLINTHVAARLITPDTNQIKVHRKSYFTLREISKALSNLRENLISKTDLVSNMLGAYNKTFILQLAVENIYYKSQISLKTFNADLTHLTKFC